MPPGQGHQATTFSRAAASPAPSSPGSAAVMSPPVLRPGRFSRRPTSVLPTAIYPSCLVIVGTILFSLTSLRGAYGAHSSVVKVVDFSAPAQLNHLAVDASGTVFVGAVNALYRLRPDLTFIQNVSTGPVWDNKRCTFPFSGDREGLCNQRFEKKLTKNYNKILLVIQSQRKLLTCGSVEQGTCQIRHLGNLSNLESFASSRDHYVAANDERSSTIGFLGSGPDEQSKVLYTGITVSSQHYARAIGVASRVLTGNTLTFTYTNPFDAYGSFLMVKSNYQDVYKVHYVAGFAVGAFNYFLTVQRKMNSDSITNEYISKISQVCGQDNKFRSYVEMPLECQGGNKNYNILKAAVVGRPGRVLASQMGISSRDQVLVATFSEGTGPDNVQNNSGVCLYSFKDIRQKFTQNIRECYQGRGGIIKYLTTETMFCDVDKKVTITEDFCGADSEINTPVEGNLSLFSNPVLTYNDVNITAVAMSVIEEHTVAFLGTYTGHLKKIVLQRDGMGAREYSDIAIDNKPILPDIRFDPNNTHIYVMTRRKLFRIRVSECEKYTECHQCIVSTDDPYCGWCSLERRCVHKEQCPKSKLRNFWLSPKSWGCIRIKEITPDRASVSRQEQVTVRIDQLPNGTERNYVCMFGDIETNADSVINEVIKCRTPPRRHIPPVRNGNDHVNVSVAIKSVDTNMSFVQTTFTFYDCSRHQSCTTCTMAKWGCNWCVHSNGCVSVKDKCSHSADQGFSDTNMCPHLEPLTSDLLVPVGIQWEIKLRARNLPEPLSDESGYTCIIHHQTPPVNVTARRVNARTIVCDATMYDYMRRKKKEAGKIDVIWNRSFYIDDVNDVQAQFYKCDLMGEDCSLCISLAQTEPEYQCRWCGNICKYTAPGSTTCTATSRLSNCPQPQLTGVNPLTGPLGGGTHVTISGSNLGTNFDQIRDGIFIAGRKCNPIRDMYETARKIVCVTEKVPSPLLGPIVVKIGAANATFESFQYQDPVVEGLSPTVGPMAGGTEVTISGQNLNTGGEILVSLDSLPCILHKEVSATKITCLTRRVNRPRTTNRVRVKFDGNLKSKHVVYNYTLNPNITNVYPRESYRSGGRVLTVEGTYFDVIQKPGFFIKSGEMNSTTHCKKVNDTVMRCPVPDIRDLLRTTRRRRDVSDGTKYEMGFVMDNVTEVANLARSMPWVDSQLVIYPDPVINNFTDFPKVYTGGALVLEGSGLTMATTQSEITVMIGKEYCKIETLSNTKLVCYPPDEQPPGVDENGLEVTTKLPAVKVIINNGFRQVVGTLEYQQSTSKLYFPPIAIVGIVAGGSILIIIIIIILIIYRRKSTEAERQYKKMQIQLDTLESNVRNECKQAFAELQTEVTDLTSDLNMTGIPFWDYKTYTFKVLFPSHTDHPVLHSKLDGNETTKHGGYEQGLQQFNQLLNSKQFLIIFIRTLESQKNFSIRDKAIVASLLMIVLQDKMEYATEILKALLNELIDKSVEKKHPKLMLRRTESVVEKFLTNWLSICMYSYLKKHAGKSMFMLFKAIKHQTEKGPVDAITSESRYSLSEDRLLREKIEPKTLMINLVVEHEDEMVMCKVLDCDTVTQAKEKALDAIYMNTPCSRRPSVHDVDLEWRSGRSGHLPLQDEDVTTQMIHGWKRINTLAHYHVPDGAIMSLSPSRNKNDMTRAVHGMVEITSGSPLSSITPIITVEEGHKVWHLVKHDDFQNQSRAQKVISEIFLTRLLSTKGTLQQFIDDLFLMVLKVDNSVPPAIKYLFDFLDQAARRHNIVDPEVVHTWKSNSLPLRFWVNLIKNPEFVFDIRKSNIVDSCLSVIAQTFMDSCSTTEHRLGKDSPSNKLLFARDIPKYRKWVEKFYKEVQEMPPVSDHEMNSAMTELSMMLSVSEQDVNLLMSEDIPRQYVVDFNVSCALKELYKYATQYNIELLESLDDDPSARKLHLAHKFEQVSAHIEGTPLY